MSLKSILENVLLKYLPIFLFLSNTVAPKRLFVVSISSNNPLISSSASRPIALDSIALNILAKSTFKFSLSFAFLTYISKKLTR